MSLTTSQTIDLFRILQTSYTGSVSKPLGEFNLSYREHEPTETQKLQTRIEERIAALSSEEENWLVQKLNAWQLIGINTASIDGSVGGVQGVFYDPEKQRSNIRADILTLIPVYQYQAELAIEYDKRRGAAGFWSCASHS